MTFRPIAETVRSGFTAEREAELLAKWHGTSQEEAEGQRLTQKVLQVR